MIYVCIPFYRVPSDNYCFRTPTLCQSLHLVFKCIIPTNCIRSNRASIIFYFTVFFFNGLDKWSESSSNLLNATQMKMVQLFGNNCSAFTKMHFLFLLDTQLDYIFQPCLTMEVEISSSSRKLMAGYFQAWHIKTTYMILCFLFSLSLYCKVTSEVTLSFVC